MGVKDVLKHWPSKARPPGPAPERWRRRTDLQSLKKGFVGPSVALAAPSTADFGHCSQNWLKAARAVFVRFKFYSARRKDTLSTGPRLRSDRMTKILLVALLASQAALEAVRKNFCG